MTTTPDQTIATEFQGCHTGIVKHLHELAGLPALLKPADQARKNAQDLTQQHRDVEDLWESLVPGLKAVAHGKDSQLNVADLEKMINSYNAHAQYEERVYLPLAKEILGRSDAKLAALGMSLHLHHLKASTRIYI